MRFAPLALASVLVLGAAVVIELSAVALASQAQFAPQLRDGRIVDRVTLGYWVAGAAGVLGVCAVVSAVSEAFDVRSAGARVDERHAAAAPPSLLVPSVPPSSAAPVVKPVVTASRSCPRCGKTNDATAKACWKCGRVLVDDLAGLHP